jgi:hypothetical protein
MGQIRPFDGGVVTEKTVTEMSDSDAALFDLGVVLGQTHAFIMVAGRCSAAQAQGLKHMREEKLYKRCTESWADFCDTYLKISRTEADRTIRLLEEFGPTYFDLSQLTRISPETYRAIAPAVKDGSLQVNGETIPLIPENSRKVTAAVSELRRSLLAFGGSLRMTDRIVDLDKRVMAIVAEFEEIGRHEALAENRGFFLSALKKAQDELDRVARENATS